MGASSATAFALGPRRPAAVTTVRLWNGENRQNGNDDNGVPLQPQFYDVTLSDGNGACFNLGGLTIDNKTTSISVPARWSCTLYE
ncbi:hypothetical protein BFW01_g6237 [Lasiodiplodia theobromae]|nr:hypothetical protein BFW01_g6237 [Lasiodiplodia theobromae]